MIWKKKFSQVSPVIRDPFIHVDICLVHNISLSVYDRDLSKSAFAAPGATADHLAIDRDFTHWKKTDQENLQGEKHSSDKIE